MSNNKQAPSKSRLVLNDRPKQLPTITINGNTFHALRDHHVPVNSHGITYIYVVFNRPIDYADRVAMISKGVEYETMLADDTILYNFRGRDMDKIRRLQCVEVANVYTPEIKVKKTLMDELELRLNPNDPADTIDICIQLHTEPAQTPEDIAAQLPQLEEGAITCQKTTLCARLPLSLAQQIILSTASIESVYKICWIETLMPHHGREELETESGESEDVSGFVDV